MEQIENPVESLDSLRAGAAIYFIGIGGVSMGGLAKMALQLGYRIAGSDPHESERTKQLEAMGVTIHYQHHPQWIEDFMPDVVIYTAAIPYWNVEMRRAAELGVPCIDRAVFLGWLTRAYDHVINVAGTHGKTTTTAMISDIMIETQRDPSVHLGAEFADFGHSTVRLGRTGDLLISEACEYNNSLLHFHSTTAVLLNIDYDHMDFFSGIDDLIETFAKFTAELPEGGHLIYWRDGEYIEQFLERSTQLRSEARAGRIHRLSFGIADAEVPLEDFPTAADRGGIADYAAANLSFEAGYPRFDVYRRGIFYCSIKLSVPGRHNVLNALAAIAASDVNRALPEACERALAHFEGTEGRFTFKGRYHGAEVVADYAHHPSSTVATLEAARALAKKRIHVVYQPLTFARVKQLFDRYVEALRDCEDLIFFEIYSDRESDTLGMSSRLICEALQQEGCPAVFAEDYPAIVEHLSREVEAGDLILFLGPEQVRSFADRLVREA
ncbi:MAG: UDP-N-acetylmuramate--L-alanine ligase [Eubacteriales bacterium]|nr:UDP-N-acetylmuramate--L-alanine ligase [Eubacteriales bacterium]